VSDILVTLLTSSITPFMERNGMSAAEVVSQLRAAVEEKTGLTISAGIAPNKMLAKVSDAYGSAERSGLLG
jgi:nucleotidyltransferase/DNA polymerase involved in DNA repair